MENTEFQDMRETLRETVTALNQVANMVLRHSEQIGAIDERLDRVGRHLEVLSDISDDLIRNKADRKKR